MIYRKIENDKEQSLKQCLQYFCGDIAKMQINKAIQNKDVKVNGKRVKNNVLLSANDMVEIYFNVPKQKMYDVIFEDENVLIVNKLRGIETTSFDENKQTLHTLILKEHSNARPVHRLDTNTLGLVVFALNEQVEKVLLEAFKNGDVIKKYYAVVSSCNILGRERFEDNFIKTEGNTVRFEPKSQDGVVAQLDYELVKSSGDLALIEVNLHTGRTHQIRAQLAYHKIYVLGDGKYGDKGLNRKHKKDYQMLYSVYLRFSNLSDFKYLQSLSFDIRYMYKSLI